MQDFQQRDNQSPSPHNVAVILAAGSGARFGHAVPKQFLTVNDRMVFEYSLETFEKHPAIDEILLVCHPDYLETAQSACSRNAWRKVSHILPGGRERYESAMAAISALQASNPCNVILHDAARPLLSAKIVTEVTEALQFHEAVNVAVPMTDTVLQTDPSGNHIQHVPDRCMLMASQTPQAFRFQILQEAYRRATAAGPIQTTDECGIILRFMPNVPVFIVPGDPRNFKVTYPDDLDRLALLLNRHD